MTQKRILIGPFNRVEGDLEVDVAIVDGHVSDARVNSPLFRGFEQILQGKDPRDALVYTPRICGICSVAQSVAAAMAIADAQKIEVARNGRLATNIILATENLADHLTHFYLFFMPDFARDYYRPQAWFGDTEARFKAQRGSAAPAMLQARAAFLNITGILAGKWPHSMSLQPGGSTRAVAPQERIRLLALLGQFRQFLQTTLFGDSLDNIAALNSREALYRWAEAHPDSDFGRFLHIAGALSLHTLGRATDRFLSYGAYALDDGAGHVFSRGSFDGRVQALDTAAISEDISHSWMDGPAQQSHPFDSDTRPGADAGKGYTWCKAPRLAGKVMECGAIARQVVHGHPLIRDLVAQHGGNVESRIVARMLELALLVPQMENWVRELRAGEAFCNQAPLPDDADGAGLTEAARGSLGHWLRIRDGRIHNYQIIAPTTWNFSPRDAQGTPGALEQALPGTPVADDDEQRVNVQHVVRSFDPCMVCTVH
ncbi:nickel-dependent hydrogenase large subunit [Granulosicoccaceae sp. 1_MG-2023]|nr:nickel-dependent hydrogenase large subunit [Granulosicoccaceae sp. 1_MG-2023]